MEKVITIILAGGQGTRLYPLTEKRCKPHVHFGGHHRLIDIPIEHSLEADVDTTYVLSQHFSSSLHSHIVSRFENDVSLHRLEHIFPKNSSPAESYEGTADAVRKNISLLKNSHSSHTVILSGDQLYSMDIPQFIKAARTSNAGLTIATRTVTEKDAYRMGLLKLNSSSKVTEFVEKPTTHEMLAPFATGNNMYHASMGMYVFKTECLISLLESIDAHDFGKDIIPTYIADGGDVYGYTHNGYWEDIGTITSYFNAHKLFTQSETHTLPKPPLKVQLMPQLTSKEDVICSIVCEGSHIHKAFVNNSTIGSGCTIQKGSRIESCILLSSSEKKAPLHIGENCHIKDAIIDENVTIGNNVTLINHENHMTYDSDTICIRDGIFVVKSGTVLLDGYSFSKKACV